MSDTVWIPPVPEINVEDMFDSPELKEKYKDWVYRDMSWALISDFERLFSIVGEENIVTLVKTVRGDMMRGQFIASPEGLQRAIQWVENRKKSNDQR